ncbi:MAG: hypothetical protein ACLS4Z_02915 [Christensenellaceae bacterium]
MDEKPYEEIIGRELAFLSEAGFRYEYLYDKGSDSSCVYIYRLKKGDFSICTVSAGEGEFRRLFGREISVSRSSAPSQKNVSGVCAEAFVQKGNRRGALAVRRGIVKSGSDGRQAVRYSVIVKNGRRRRFGFPSA